MSGSNKKTDEFEFLVKKALDLGATAAKINPSDEVFAENHVTFKCNLEEGICRHPSQARMPEHAVGINMKKTSQEAGLGLKFPIDGRPDAIALLLID